MVCKYCGRNFTTKFCPGCGASSEEMSESIINNDDLVEYEYEPVDGQKTPEKKPNTALIVLIAVLCVALIGAGVFAYLYFSNRDKDDDKDSKKSKKEPVSVSEKYEEVTEDEESDDVDYDDDYDDYDDYDDDYDSDVGSGVNAYENDDVGLGIDFDDDWEVVTMEDDGTSGYDSGSEKVIMTAENKQTKSNISISVVDLNNMSVSDYFDGVYDTVIDMFDSMGVTASDYDSGTIDIDGEEYEAFAYDISGDADEGSQLIFFVDGYDTYMITVTFVGDDADNVDDIMDRFYSLP